MRTYYCGECRTLKPVESDRGWLDLWCDKAGRLVRCNARTAEELICVVNDCPEDRTGASRFCSYHFHQKYRLKIPVENMRPAEKSLHERRVEVGKKARAQTMPEMLPAGPLLKVAKWGASQEALERHPESLKYAGYLRTAEKTGTISENIADKMLLDVFGLWPYAVYDTI